MKLLLIKVVVSVLMVALFIWAPSVLNTVFEANNTVWRFFLNTFATWLPEPWDSGLRGIASLLEEGTTFILWIAGWLPWLGSEAQEVGKLFFYGGTLLATITIAYFVIGTARYTIRFIRWLLRDRNRREAGPEIHSQFVR